MVGSNTCKILKSSFLLSRLATAQHKTRFHWADDFCVRNISGINESLMTHQAGWTTSIQAIAIRKTYIPVAGSRLCPSWHLCGGQWVVNWDLFIGWNTFVLAGIHHYRLACISGSTTAMHMHITAHSPSHAAHLREETYWSPHWLEYLCSPWHDSYPSPPDHWLDALKGCQRRGLRLCLKRGNQPCYAVAYEWGLYPFSKGKSSSFLFSWFILHKTLVNLVESQHE